MPFCYIPQGETMKGSLQGSPESWDWRHRLTVFQGVHVAFLSLGGPQGWRTSAPFPPPPWAARGPALPSQTSNPCWAAPEVEGSGCSSCDPQICSLFCCTTCGWKPYRWVLLLSFFLFSSSLCRHPTGWVAPKELFCWCHSWWWFFMERLSVVPWRDVSWCGVLPIINALWTLPWGSGWCTHIWSWAILKARLQIAVMCKWPCLHCLIFHTRNNLNCTIRSGSLALNSLDTSRKGI